MKKFLIACCSFIFFISCSRKTVPSKPNYSLNNEKNNTQATIDSSMANATVADSATATSANAIMIVADGYGRLLTSQQSLPQNAGVQYNSLQLSKGFTPQQRANLQARYHTVPPRVLYVPQQLSASSFKGSYYIYKKKFWYWKKSDGLYYLDQKYYL
ncbi:MAG TPA: hypothetical protein VGI61_11455 [Parafilimonas sp.]